MQLSREEHEQIEQILRQILEDEEVQKMKTYIQHGEVTTYDHCTNVTRVSCWLSHRLPGMEGMDEEALIVGAFLHDFYQYDWHRRVPHQYTHGFRHPEKARLNAVRHFYVNRRTQHIIRSHMWPLTLRHMPRTREAWIVTLADKYCSAYETMFLRKENRPICG